MQNVTKASDRVDVVRCRDCVYGQIENDKGLRECIMLGDSLSFVKDDEYCSFGRRREDDEQA